MNVEHRTPNSPQASKHLSASGRSNVERQDMEKVTYDVEERLLEYFVRIIDIAEKLLNTKSGKPYC